MRSLLVPPYSPLFAIMLGWGTSSGCLDVPPESSAATARLVTAWDPLECGDPHRVVVELEDDGGAKLSASTPCNIGGLTLAPGLYKWTTTVSLPTSATIAGGANDVWIFQISKDLVTAAASNVVLAGGAQAKNIFWQVAGQATLGTTSHFEGTILAKTAVTLNTHASINGRILAQSQVALDDNVITQR